jgi:nitrite reductase/ring-hydroxylating ferredoxin subunit
MDVVTEAPIYRVPLELVRGRHHTARAGGLEILILDTREGVRVYSGICPHLGGPLLEGRLSGIAVVCPWHAYAFDALTGRCLTAPGGIWRAAGCPKGDGQPMAISLEPLRYEVKDGTLLVYGR